MKRLIVLVTLLCAACGREKPESETTTLPASPPPPRTETRAGTGGIIPSPPPVAVHKPNRSTPQKCAGDGSYEQALDCFRISSGFSFELADAHGVQVQGKMTRSTPGMERVQFKALDGVSWTGEAKASGVVWSRNGKHEQAPPDVTNRVWQRTTMVLDPQKREGAPQRMTDEPGGEHHYHFTNANSGEANDVWVSAKDGRITKWVAGDLTVKIK